jgi:signal peptidase I
VLLVRSFLFEPFRIPSASMMPGLVDGDYSSHRREPRRGDVVVFRLPSNPSVHFIKRLVGLPGDHIAVHDNRITINGVPVPLQHNGIYSGGYGFSGAQMAIETFGKPHVVMFAANRVPKDFDASVPPGQ